MFKSFANFLIVGLVLSFVISCDKEGKKQCSWYLEPEPKLKEKVTQGFIPVCARNRNTMKQDCRLQTTLEKAKDYYGKVFRYSDMSVKSYGLPRTIDHIIFCKG